MRPNHAAPVLGLIVLSLLVLLDSPVSHSDTSSTSSIVSIHLVGQVSAWNESQPSGPNPKITVNQGDTVSIILTSVDTMHEFIVDWDKDGASFLGSCARGDNCSSVFSLGTGTTITFTVSFPAGTYTYFCAFHAT